MPTITYTYQFSYTYDPKGHPFPILPVRVVSATSGRVVEVDVYLDCGAERSLFSGTLAAPLGIDLLQGRRIAYFSAGGMRMDAFLHAVQIQHPELGQFDLEVGFSSVSLARNLLGRDFFNLVQLGFREHHLVFYVTPEP